eukprot:13120353-Alexandrium_andersonii.AAC.1
MRSARAQMWRPFRGAPCLLNGDGPRFSRGTRRRPRLKRRTSSAWWQMRSAGAATGCCAIPQGSVCARATRRAGSRPGRAGGRGDRAVRGRSSRATPLSSQVQPVQGHSLQLT